jgi:tetrahydromethanopterin S-methyltransferase subunit G
MTNYPYVGEERRAQFIQCDKRFYVMEQKMGNIENKLDNLEEKIDFLLKVLHGNGKIGLFSKVSILWGASVFMSITIVGILVKLFIK